MLYLILSYVGKQVLLQVLLAFFFILSLSCTILPHDANSGTNQLMPRLLLQRILTWFLFTKLFCFNLSSKFASTFFTFHISPMIKIFKACSSLIKEIVGFKEAIQGFLHLSVHIYIIVHSPKGKTIPLLFQGR